MIRFSIIISILGVLCGGLVSVVAAQPALDARIEGLLMGALIGDAAGGPDEFQPPERSIWTRTDTMLTEAGIRALADRFELKPYTRRPHPESYGQWRANAPAGTVTDDSRFKIIFFKSLEAAGQPSRQHFAEALLNWYADSTSVYGNLPQLWLAEFAYAARWELGERDPALARPPERQWGGIPTMAGQMPFLPVAALAPGDPARAYMMTWDVNFMDNGIARDMNAALVAGLAAALAPDASWATIEAAMRQTDPFGFGEIGWVPRRLSRWLDVAAEVTARAEGKPYQLFRLLEEALQAETWWEAWVPMTVVFSCAQMTDYHPLATMQLIMEFGYDTDSYMQVAGALFGALHGVDVFPDQMRRVISRRLQEDYQVSPDVWFNLIKDIRK